jgi:hypothetical protein
MLRFNIMNAGRVAFCRRLFRCAASSQVIVWLAATLVFVTTAPALTLDVPSLPPPAFVDREAAGDAAIPAGARDNLRRFRLEIALIDDAGAFAFDGLPPAPPPLWLTPDNWNLLRVTVRGVAVAEEDVRVRFLPDGATIILR